jgi:hypothetical protein
MTVHVHVERLLLDGFEITPAERAKLQNAVEQELARLLARPGRRHGGPQHADDSSAISHGNDYHPLSGTGGAVPSVAAGPFNPPPGAAPAQLGKHIAQSVHGGLGSRK